MSLTAFLIAILALLLAPGPTNTLMGLAGAQRGIAASLRLIPAELVAYLLVVTPLVYLGHDLLAAAPGLGLAVKLAAAGWVMCLALKLWRLPVDGAAHGLVTARQIFLTTLLNPKALVFGLVLLPAGGQPEARLAVFAGAIIGVALLWAALGALAGGATGRAGRGMAALQRAASVWLGAVSVSIMAGALAH